MFSYNLKIRKGGSTLGRFKTFGVCTLHGFGLVEVMITLAITSVGLLGMARMVILSQQNTSESALRTTAAILAQDMIGRILSNTADSRGCQNSQYHVKGITGATQASNNTRCFGGTATNNLQSCTPAEMAQQDVLDWKAAVADANLGLPGGVGIVCCTSTLTYGSGTDYNCASGSPGGAAPTSTQFAVKLHWNGRDGVAHRLVMTAYP